MPEESVTPSDIFEQWLAKDEIAALTNANVRTEITTSLINALRTAPDALKTMIARKAVYISTRGSEIPPDIRELLKDMTPRNTQPTKYPETTDLFTKRVICATLATLEEDTGREFARTDDIIKLMDRFGQEASQKATGKAEAPEILRATSMLKTIVNKKVGIQSPGSSTGFAWRQVD